MNRVILIVSLLSLVVLGNGCKKETPLPDDPLLWPQGTGYFTFTDYAPLSNKPMAIYYHIPDQAHTQSPVLFVFHGAGRDALDCRNELIEEANQLGFVLIVPEFIEANFPGGDGYNLGNIFVDGDNPSPATLNPEEIWAYSVVDPIFEYFTQRSGSAAPYFDVFGFSAGAQVAHRLAIYKPSARINRIVAASAGWYTMPDNTVDFPYGTKNSPAENSDLGAFFSKTLTVMIGTSDNDPNSPGLRHTPQADAQGLNRLTRAQYFYSESRNLAISQVFDFKWRYQTLTNVGHDYKATSTAAVNYLYK